MNSLIQLNNLNNTKNTLIINEFTKLINETKDVINYYSYLDQSIKDPSKKYNKYVYKNRDENDTTIPENKPDSPLVPKPVNRPLQDLLDNILPWRK